MKKLQHCRLHVLDRHLLVDIRLDYHAAAHPSFSRCQCLGICAILTVDNSASARYVLDEYEVISFHNDCPLKIFNRLAPLLAEATARTSSPAPWFGD